MLKLTSFQLGWVGYDMALARIGWYDRTTMKTKYVVTLSISILFLFASPSTIFIIVGIKPMSSLSIFVQNLGFGKTPEPLQPLQLLNSPTKPVWHATPLKTSHQAFLPKPSKIPF
jgi:hypothetical protein